MEDLSPIHEQLQEALTNARRHSRADQVHVELFQQGNELRIEVRDAGVGFNPDKVRVGCFGLQGIQQRAKLLGGRAEITSRRGNGARISVTLPLD